MRARRRIALGAAKIGDAAGHSGLSGHTPSVLVCIRAGFVTDLPTLRDLFHRSSLANKGDRDVLLAHPEALELADDAIVEGRLRWR